MSIQGTWLSLDRVFELTFEAASPMISRHFTNARASNRSCAKSAAVRPDANVTASRAASSMWRSRARSFGGILNHRSADHLVAKIAAEFLGCPKVNLPAAEYRGQFALHCSHPQVADRFSLCELHKYIDIALVRKTVRQHRAEDSEFSNAVSPAKAGHLILCDINVPNGHA